MIYDFKCIVCGAMQEIDLKISERDTEQECVICAGKLKRLISPVPNTWKTNGNADKKG